MVDAQNRDNNSDNNHTLAQKVRALLDKNPLLTPKQICELLRISHKKHGRYISQIKTKWKYSPRNERGSHCSIHAWRGFLYVPGGLDRGLALRSGWCKTRARNRWLLFKTSLGRLQWFETNRVNLYVRKPASMGRAYMLFVRGFAWTRIINNLDQLQKCLKSIRFKGAHYVFETGHKGPRLTIDLFGPSNGVVVKLWDRSHPTGAEFLVTYPDWQERNERLLERLLAALEGSTNIKRPERKYWV